VLSHPPRGYGCSRAPILHSAFFLLPSLYLPRRSHRLLDERIGFVIADEALLLGIKPQRTAGLHGDLRQVDERAGAVAVDLVKRELLPGLDGFDEVRDLRLGIGQVL
jgi:hypothetical protein